MQTLEAITTVEVPVEALINELGAKRAFQFIKEITACYDESIIEIKKGTKTLSIEQLENGFVRNHKK